MKNLVQFCNVYQFIQRMNKAYHMSSNYVTSLDQFKQLKLSEIFGMLEQFRRPSVRVLCTSLS